MGRAVECRVGVRGAWSGRKRGPRKEKKQTERDARTWRASRCVWRCVQVARQTYSRVLDRGRQSSGKSHLHPHTLLNPFLAHTRVRHMLRLHALAGCSIVYSCSSSVFTLYIPSAALRISTCCMRMVVSCEVIFFFSCSVVAHARHTLSNSKPLRRREGGEGNTHVSIHRVVVCDAPLHSTTQYILHTHSSHSSPTHSLLSLPSRVLLPSERSVSMRSLVPMSALYKSV